MGQSQCKSFLSSSLAHLCHLLPHLRLDPTSQQYPLAQNHLLSPTLPSDILEAFQALPSQRLNF